MLPIRAGARYSLRTPGSSDGCFPCFLLCFSLSCPTQGLPKVPPPCSSRRVAVGSGPKSRFRSHYLFPRSSIRHRPFFFLLFFFSPKVFPSSREQAVEVFPFAQQRAAPLFCDNPDVTSPAGHPAKRSSSQQKTCASPVFRRFLFSRRALSQGGVYDSVNTLRSPTRAALAQGPNRFNEPCLRRRRSSARWPLSAAGLSVREHPESGPRYWACRINRAAD